MSSSTDLVAGTIFANRYRILRRIAAGGMGAVYEALHLETQRRRALKVMHASLFQNDEMRERFRREATVAAQIESEFIVDVFDAGVDEATSMPFLVMELLRGEELGQRLKRVGRFVPEEAVDYLRYVALALDKTHQASIVHRDLKPANVFLAEREEGGVRVKVLDFGIAKIVAEGATTGGTTQSLGTPLYMAPEQFNPRSKLTNAVDIYALGMMAYTLLVGVPYWFEEARGGNVYAVVALAIHGIPEAPSIRAAGRGVQLSPAFDAWFAKATALDPKHRFSTATLAIQELGAALALSPAGRVSLPSATAETSAAWTPQVGMGAMEREGVTPMPTIGAGGTTRLGQTPDSTFMSAAATLTKPARTTPIWLFVAGGCFSVLSVGLGIYFVLRSQVTTPSTTDSSMNNTSANSALNPPTVVPAAAPVPIEVPAAMMSAGVSSATAQGATSETPTAPKQASNATTATATVRTVKPTPTTTAPTAPTTPPRKKTYTRE